MQTKGYFANLRAERKAKGLCLSCGKHPSPCFPCRQRNKEYMRRKRAGLLPIEKQKVWRDKRDYFLKRKFGIGIDEYNKMLKKQNNSCAICKSTTTQDRRTNNFPVDHCHKTGKVRGLLCNHCNRALGMFKDNIESLKSAISYLEKYK